MTTGLTPDGFTRKRLTDIKAEIENALKAVFGTNIDLSAQSVFGQLIGIFSEAVSDQWESQENVYNSQYPSTATKNQLSNVVMYNGLERQAATFSTVTVTLTGVAGTVIPEGSLISVENTGAQFETLAEATIPAGGSIDVNTQSIVTGAVEAASGTLNTIDTPVFGWTGVTNALDAFVGRDEETDAELRERRELSTQALGQNLVDSLFGQLLNLQGVEDAVVISNGTDTTDVNGIPPHRFLSVVLGGSNEDVANAIWKNTPQGINSYGSQSETVTDQQGFPQVVYFSRPTEVPIYFRLVLHVVSTFQSSVVGQLKQDLVDYGQGRFKISDDVLYFEFFTPVNATEGIVSVDMYMGLSATPTEQENIEIAAEELPKFDAGLIQVDLIPESN